MHRFMQMTNKASVLALNVKKCLLLLRSQSVILNESEMEKEMLGGSIDVKILLK